MSASAIPGFSSGSDKSAVGWVDHICDLADGSAGGNHVLHEVLVCLWLVVHRRDIKQTAPMLLNRLEQFGRQHICRISINGHGCFPLLFVFELTAPVIILDDRPLYVRGMCIPDSWRCVAAANTAGAFASGIKKFAFGTCLNVPIFCFHKNPFKNVVHGFHGSLYANEKKKEVREQLWSGEKLKKQKKNNIFWG